MKIIWPIISKKSWTTYSKDGSIDGISFKKVLKNCEKEADKYIKLKFPNVCKEIENG